MFRPSQSVFEESGSLREPRSIRTWLATSLPRPITVSDPIRSAIADVRDGFASSVGSAAIEPPQNPSRRACGTWTIRPPGSMRSVPVVGLAHGRDARRGHRVRPPFEIPQDDEAGRRGLRRPEGRRRRWCARPRSSLPR